MDVLVAGHVCLDIIPALEGRVEFRPGALVEAGAATLSPGGAVANVGTVLSRLGARTRMVGRVGDDPLGRIVRDRLSENAPRAEVRVKAGADAHTSYTVVLNLAGEDRMFLHSPGANRSFRSSDVADEDLADVRLMHFGYPPLMEAIYSDGGRELASLLERARSMGVLTSLDMSLPDPESPSGSVDWSQFLARVLPSVDYFLPSFDELAFMLPPSEVGGGSLENEVVELASLCRTMGAGNVGLKLGSRGVYFRSGEGREFWQPCFPCKFAGATGSGDATIAGFLVGLLSGETIADALRLGCATGACCCEKPDAVSGVVDRLQVQGRLS